MISNEYQNICSISASTDYENSNENTITISNELPDNYHNRITDRIVNCAQFYITRSNGSPFSENTITARSRKPKYCQEQICKHTYCRNSRENRFLRDVSEWLTNSPKHIISPEENSVKHNDVWSSFEITKIQEWNIPESKDDIDNIVHSLDKYENNKSDEGYLLYAAGNGLYKISVTPIVQSSVVHMIENNKALLKELTTNYTYWDVEIDLYLYKKDISKKFMRYHRIKKKWRKEDTLTVYSTMDDNNRIIALYRKPEGTVEASQIHVTDKIVTCVRPEKALYLNPETGQFLTFAELLLLIKSNTTNNEYTKMWANYIGCSKSANKLFQSKLEVIENEQKEMKTMQDKLTQKLMTTVYDDDEYEYDEDGMFVPKINQDTIDEQYYHNYYVHQKSEWTEQQKADYKEFLKTHPIAPPPDIHYKPIEEMVDKELQNIQEIIKRKGKETNKDFIKQNIDRIILGMNTDP